MSHSGGVSELTVAEGREYFDRTARRLLDMSGEQFVEKYEAGAFDPAFLESHHSELVTLELLLPFIR